MQETFRRRLVEGKLHVVAGFAYALFAPTFSYLLAASASQPFRPSFGMYFVALLIPTFFFFYVTSVLQDAIVMVFTLLYTNIAIANPDKITKDKALILMSFAPDLVPG